MTREIKMPKCLFINPDFPPPFVGGSVVYYYHEHRAFDRNDLVVMTARAPGDTAFDAGLPYKVVRTDCMTWTSLIVPKWQKVIGLWRQFWLARRLVREEGISIVHVGQMYPGIVLGMALSLITGCPCVVTVLAEELTVMPSVGGLRRRCVLWALRRARTVFTISRFTRQVLIDQGVDSERIVLVPPCADPTKCDPSKVKEPLCAARLAGKRILLTVGRLTRRKGQDMVLQALPSLLQDHADLHYVMVGQGEDESRLRAMSAELGIEDRVTMVTDASEEESAWFYKNCEVFVSPNRTLANGDTEGFGIVFLEAGFWGKPVIGGNAGGVPDAIEDKVTGLLVDGSEAADIARAIRVLLEDPELGRRMGMEGQRRSQSDDWTTRSLELKRWLGAIR